MNIQDKVVPHNDKKRKKTAFCAGADVYILGDVPGGISWGNAAERQICCRRRMVPADNAFRDCRNCVYTAGHEERLGCGMLVVIAPAKRPAYIKEIDGSLQTMQGIVGGYIEVTKLTQGINIVCNREGTLKELPVNMHLPWLVGDVFLISSEIAGDGEMVGLNRRTAENWVQCINCGVLTR